MYIILSSDIDHDFGLGICRKRRGYGLIVQFYYNLNLILISLEYCMISFKIPASTAIDNENAKSQKSRHSKTQNNNYATLAEKTYPDHQLVLLDTSKNTPFFATPEEETTNKLKLPKLRKPSSDLIQQASLYADRKNEQISTISEQLKRLQAHPYLRKYVDMTSHQKIRRDNSCNFLNIISVKPIFRSSSRMGNKDISQTLNQEKTQKIIMIKDREERKLIRESDKINTVSLNKPRKSNHSSGKKRDSNVSTGDITNFKQRLSGTMKESLLPIRQKKKSLTLLKLQRPKQSPNYYQWCLLIGLIDGMISQKEGSISYKAFIGKGNNSILVKNIIKSRSWWTLCQDQTQANLFWNQSRHPKFIESLKEGKIEESISWENTPKLRMQIMGNCESGLSDKIRSSIGMGFDKILSKSQKERFCKSPVSLQLYYPKNSRILDSNKAKSHNHLQFNWNLSNKKALYYNLKSYYLAMGKNPFQNIPQTYHVQKQGDQQWNNFLKGYENKGLWIVKPGENSNRGCGIDVVQTLDEVRQIVRNKSIRPNGKERSHIVQRYLMPFLYNKRKFDIRCYMLVTSINGNLRCYWYEEGYIRTASKQFTTKNLKNRMIHLTNDAVQKYSQNYGKHQSGNKLSFTDFHKYMRNNFADSGYDFFQHIYPRMIELAADAIRSTHLVIDSKHRQFSFQIFGLDFMIDDNFRTWLIEVNTNPCLQLSCPLLARIIPAMVQSAFKIAVDAIFPPPKDINRLKNSSDQLFENNKFSLIFNSREQAYLQTVLKSGNVLNIIESEDEQSNCEDEQ